MFQSHNNVGYSNNLSSEIESYGTAICNKIVCFMSMVYYLFPCSLYTYNIEYTKKIMATITFVKLDICFCVSMAIKCLNMFL